MRDHAGLGNMQNQKPMEPRRASDELRKLVGEVGVLFKVGMGRIVAR